MTAKAKMKESSEPNTAPDNGSLALPVKAAYELIPRTDLVVSPTNPRRRINNDKVQSLASSIRTQGIIEPLIVRKVVQNYEIVCGEMRYRAAEIAEITDLPCLVRELSDEQVLDIQIHENLHREDIHPMDEAFSYQFLKEKLGCDVIELALRVGKSEGYVLNRLKLNQLIKEAQRDVDDGHLPLVYALEITKYTPEIQKVIYGEVYKKQGMYKGNDYVYVPLKGETVPWKSFIEWINTNIHRLLSKAPFDAKAINLRSDGLACIKCPERTGAVVSLFEPNQVGKTDACLNPACYVQKVQTHIEVRRRELAEAAGVEPLEVPVVRSWCYTDGKDYLGTESAAVISGVKRGGNAKNCDKAVSAIDIESDNYGQTIQVCLKSTACKIHWNDRRGSSNGTSPNAESAEAEAAERLESHRARREEIWNAKVAEASRIRVFKQAAENFEKKFEVTEVGIDFLPQLIAKFWRMTSSGDGNNLNSVVKRLVGEWDGEQKNGNGLYLLGDSRTAIDQLKKLEGGTLFRILYLLIHGHKGSIGHGNNYRSQVEVRELAAEFEVDYALIDAEVRIELCPKKHNQVHKTYLEAVQEKRKDAKVPKLFSETWKPAD